MHEALGIRGKAPERYVVEKFVGVGAHIVLQRTTNSVQSFMTDRAIVFVDGNNQRRFLARLAATDKRISYHLGRLEPRTVLNEAAGELRQYLREFNTHCDPLVFQDLMALANKHLEITVMVEKAVDVHIAVDMVMMAQQDDFDVAYLLSADGDFTPAVKAVRSLGKKVFGASPLYGAELASVVNAFIRLDAKWFSDCYRAR